MQSTNKKGDAAFDWPMAFMLHGIIFCAVALITFFISWNAFVNAFFFTQAILYLFTIREYYNFTNFKSNINQTKNNETKNV